MISIMILYQPNPNVGLTGRFHARILLYQDIFTTKQLASYQTIITKKNKLLVNTYYETHPDDEEDVKGNVDKCKQTQGYFIRQVCSVGTNLVVDYWHNGMPYTNEAQYAHGRQDVLILKNGSSNILFLKGVFFLFSKESEKERK